MIIGQSPEILKIKKFIKEISKTNDNVLITGETGTGKKHLAREIHSKSKNNHQPFIVLNCTAVGDIICEDDLFGVAKNIPNSIEQKTGILEQASNGILYMENIDDLNPIFQELFFIVFSERKFKKKGVDQLLTVDFRIIAASTDYKLNRMDNFRKDLLAILNKFTVHIPPLRDRRQDIQVLFNYYLKQFCEEFNREIPCVTFELNESILEFDWPSNAEELKNTVRNLVLMSPWNELSTEYLPFEVKKHPLSSIENLNLRDAVSEVEKYLIRKNLRKNYGNKIRTAKSLKVSEAVLYQRMKKYGFPKNLFNKK